MEQKDLNGAEDDMDIEGNIVDPILIDWVKGKVLEKLLLRDFPVKSIDIQKFEELEKIWTKENQKATSSFLIHDHIQFLFVSYEGDPANISSVKLHTSLKPVFHSDCKIVLYMVKEVTKQISIDEVKDMVSFGIIENSPLESLLKMMRNDFAPDLVAKKTQWPDSKFFE